VILTFAALCVLALVSSIISDIGTNYVGQRIIAALRKDLGEKVLSAPIGQIEGYRSHRLIPVLTHDVDTISDFSFAFTPLAIAATVTLGCLGYLAYLSVPMFLMMVVAIVIGSAVQFIAGGRASRASTWRATMRMSCSVTTTPSPAAPRNCACTGPGVFA
jgi:putative ATP-binding cassette transporter